MLVKDIDRDRDLEETKKKINLRGFLNRVKRTSRRQGRARRKLRYKLSPLHQQFKFKDPLSKYHNRLPLLL